MGGRSVRRAVCCFAFVGRILYLSYRLLVCGSLVMESHAYFGVSLWLLV